MFTHINQDSSKEAWEDTPDWQQWLLLRKRGYGEGHTGRVNFTADYFSYKQGKWNLWFPHVIFKNRKTEPIDLNNTINESEQIYEENK